MPKPGLRYYINAPGVHPAKRPAETMVKKKRPT